MIFKKKCKHNLVIVQTSNVIQLDEMGYPLRLCIEQCKKCGKSKQSWIDISVESLKELDSGKSVLCIWKGENTNDNH